MVGQVNTEFQYLIKIIFFLNVASMNKVVVLELVTGDQVRLYNYGGEIAGDTDITNTHFHFVGVLLYATGQK